MISPQKYIQSCLLLPPHLLCSGYTGLVPIPQIYQMWPSKSLYLDVPFFLVDNLMVHPSLPSDIPLSLLFHRAFQGTYLRLQVLFHSKHYCLLTFTKLFPYSIQYCLILYYYKFFCPSEFLP